MVRLVLILALLLKELELPDFQLAGNGHKQQSCFVSLITILLRTLFLDSIFRLGKSLNEVKGDRGRCSSERMARMHARTRGKAGSKKPISKTAPSWLTYKKAEVEQLVVKLAKKGLQTSQIGLQLRDSYGIPDVKMITKRSISQILEDNKLMPEIPEDLKNLVKRVVQVKKHLESNKKDEVSKRGLQLLEAKIRRLEKYYRKNNKLPKKWVYKSDKAKLLAG